MEAEIQETKNNIDHNAHIYPESIDLDVFRQELLMCLKTSYEAIQKMSQENLNKLAQCQKSFVAILHGTDFQYQVNLSPIKNKKEEEFPLPQLV
jgi:hypothetical protein